MNHNFLTRIQILTNISCIGIVSQITALNESPLVWQKFMSLYSIRAVKGRHRWRLEDGL